MNKKRKTPPVADSDDGDRVVAAVSDDVLKEFLVRLPAKSVTRFKLVCKHWLSLISADHFRRLHTLRRHKTQPSLLLRMRTSQEFFYLNPIINGEKPKMIPYNITLPNPKILSSCNGLMLLQCYNPQSDYYVNKNPQTEYYVYNPATKQSRKIILDYDDKFPSIEGLNLAFDPSKSPHYSIVCVRGSRPFYLIQSYKIVVYDSVSHTWKLRMEPFTGSLKLNFSSGVHWNNSIYWKTDDDITCFDIDKNVIASLPGPKIPWNLVWSEHWINEFYCSQLQESNGHLYYIFIKGESIALWELQGEDRSRSRSQWLLKYHDHPQQGSFRRECSSGLLRFISASDKSTLVTFVPGKIRAYRFLDKSFEELVDLTDQPFYRENSLHFGFQEVHHFSESLALV